MDTIGTVANVVTAAVAIAAALIAITQIRLGRRDAKAARVAELSWSIYQAYDSPELREGRRSLNNAARNVPIPASGKQFGEMYVAHNYQGPDHDTVIVNAERVSSASIRRMLRFYQQVAILLEKELIDADFIFPMIGDGLEMSESAIKTATEWHRQFYSGESGNEPAEKRAIYNKVNGLLVTHRMWKSRQGLS